MLSEVARLSADGKPRSRTLTHSRPNMGAGFSWRRRFDVLLRAVGVICAGGLHVETPDRYGMANRTSASSCCRWSSPIEEQTIHRLIVRTAGETCCQQRGSSGGRRRPATLAAHPVVTRPDTAPFTSAATWAALGKPAKPVATVSCTNCVFASRVLLSPPESDGTVSVPVNAGLARGAKPATR